MKNKWNRNKQNSNKLMMRKSIQELNRKIQKKCKNNFKEKKAKLKNQNFNLLNLFKENLLFVTILQVLIEIFLKLKEKNLNSLLLY